MALTKKITKDTTRASELEKALRGQFNRLHRMNYFDDYKIESLLLEQKKLEVEYIKNRFQTPKGYVRFSPSSADACKRGLFYKALGVPPDNELKHPYQSRWTRNSSAIHEAVQRDLLYMEKLLSKPAFTVARMPETGLPAWEKNLQNYKIIKHNGVEFVLYGMMDGILEYKDGSRIGFEFKTKSTKQDRVHKLTKPSPSHIKQTVAYSLLFDIDEYLITYESVAKDEWRAGVSAYEDIKPMYHKVTEKEKLQLLDRFAEITVAVQTGEIPDMETSKCMFCKYKSKCLGGNE